MRFLRARAGSYEKAIDLLREDLTWRQSFRPHKLRAEHVEEESKTGKMRVAQQLDRHGRAVVVMHGTYENTKDYEGQINVSPARVAPLSLNLAPLSAPPHARIP